MMSKALYTVLGLLLLSLMLGLAVANPPTKAGKSVEGSSKAEKGESCVRPTDWMRRNHMELIQHSRDLTVHQGIRVKKDSLANCVDCHSRQDEHHQAVPVNAPGEFCDGCHSYTAVNITCFQCHATVPETKSAQR
jgi:hypothetical protein